MKICFFTATRAEYGLLVPLMRLFDSDFESESHIVVSGAHLSEEYGLTYRDIEADGFKISERADILKFGSSRAGILKSVGLACQLYADILERLKPDMAVILGDRYEMLAAAESCFLMNVPIAHLYGGETTEGAFDDSIRHAITKLADIHFTSTEEYRQRVIRMGEHPDRVFHVGSLGVEIIKNMPLMTKAEVNELLGADDKKIVMMTYHPETNDSGDICERFACLTRGIEKILEQDDFLLVITGANADPSGDRINEAARDFTSKYPDNVRFFTSLGHYRYLSVLKYASCVLGNSSSGIIEAPSFGVPVINVGGRQGKRACADSVVHCGYEQEAIAENLQKALGGLFCTASVNPYEKADTASEIFRLIKKCRDVAKLPKTFYERDYEID